MQSLINPEPSETQWLPYETRILKFSNSSFLSQIEFLCFLWISKETAIISQYIINHLGFFFQRTKVFTARYEMNI
jgi:hypothetical protein